jgi:inorganic triphosphatase YgiF
MQVEVELKYLASGAEILERLAAEPSIGPAELGPPRTISEIDRYLDTRDGRLGAARWACRLRDREGSLRISLKGPPEAGAAGALHRRPELEGPAKQGLDPSAWPPGDARSLLDELRAGEPLVERLRLRQTRTERTVMVGGEAIGTLTLDVVDVEADGRDGGRLFVVELELAGEGVDAETVLERLRPALEATPGLVPDDRTKLERALGMLGLA